jgi:hypothetical protein
MACNCCPNSPVPRRDTHSHIHTLTHIHSHIHTHTHSHIHTLTHSHTHSHTLTHTHTHSHITQIFASISGYFLKVGFWSHRARSTGIFQASETHCEVALFQSPRGIQDVPEGCLGPSHPFNTIRRLPVHPPVSSLGKHRGKVYTLNI